MTDPKAWQDTSMRGERDGGNKTVHVLYIRSRISPFFIDLARSGANDEERRRKKSFLLFAGSADPFWFPRHKVWSISSTGKNTESKLVSKKWKRLIEGQKERQADRRTVFPFTLSSSSSQSLSCNYVKRVVYLMCSGIINLRIRIEIERKVKIWSDCTIIFHVY